MTIHIKVNFLWCKHLHQYEKFFFSKGDDERKVGEKAIEAFNLYLAEFMPSALLLRFITDRFSLTKKSGGGQLQLKIFKNIFNKNFEFKLN